MEHEARLAGCRERRALTQPWRGDTAIGSVLCARTTLGAFAGGVSGLLAPHMIGIANVATSAVAVGSFALGGYAAGLSRSTTVSSVQCPVYNALSCLCIGR